ncbi:ABC-2 type transport system ATP-binding protein [Catenuloplanes nepalensis]|uniref:ABC-2 type transport system ATP-binding protein n=1 Tax=Catenuloplanes nepalensis TaxID=587533 RepID=A0ABT9MW22_9ACTN|nr:ABC transporter ATP-binding protein [Catenuloplanes nepalensis]MDP9795625.1 ABC-2 type transport system ATP-binding protein [Catenuloplanes nepalensis]
MTQAIEVRELRRRYGGPRGFEAVKGISFDVAHGELFALLGTNGAGKTSTMEIVEGLDRPSAGTVRLLGQDPFRNRATVRPRIGVMLQDAGFPADLTVAETARMWAGTLPDPRPVPETLELAGMSHRARVRVKQLSGGERRRLDLALALLGRPEVLFLDEPTTGLDPESRQNTWRVIRDLLVGGVTVLLTTHYLDEAQALADRLAIMHTGTIVTSGTVAQVVGAYPARITFSIPHGPEIPDLPGAPTITRDGAAVVIKTDALQATLSALLRWADDNAIPLHNLDARSASLEEAFLTIAGGTR